jgi:signal transduction histidine kinase
VTPPARPPARPPAAEDPEGSTPTRPSEVSRAGHLAFVAHEVRNPLSTALWSAELLARLSPEERAGERGTRLVGLCVKGLARVQRLVEDHLLCERLDTGGHAFHPEPLDLAALLRGVVERLGLEPAPAVEVAAGLTVRGDRALLERALAGLVSAAARGGDALRVVASAAGGEVRLRVEGDGSASLDDPGRGAPSDPSSLALALPLARRVAELHAARLTAEPSGYLLVFPGT